MDSNFGIGATVGSTFSGTFLADNNIQIFEIDVTDIATLTIQSFGYGGGTDLAGNTITPGGFATALALFDSLGNYLATGSYCGVGNPNVSTGNCLDAGLVLTVVPGTYYLALTENDNFYGGQNNSGNGGLFSSGTTVDPTAFNETYTNAIDIANGSDPLPPYPNFTTAFGCGGTAFCDPLGNQMTGDYALDIEATVPEPGSFALVGSALIFALFMFRRQRSA